MNRMNDGGTLVFCPYLVVKVWIKGQFRVSALLFLCSFALWFIFLFFSSVFSSDGFSLGFNLWRDKRTERQFRDESSHSFMLRLNHSLDSRCDVPLPERSHLDVSPPPAEGLGAHVGGHKVAVAHAPRSAQEVGQAVSDAGGGVAGSLLCCNAASGEETGG